MNKRKETEGTRARSSAARPDPPRAGPARPRSRARGGLNLPARARLVSGREGRGDAMTTSRRRRRLAGALRRAKSHDTASPQPIARGYGVYTQRATQNERRRFPEPTGATPASSSAAAEKEPRREDVSGRAIGGEGHGEVQSLTLDACASSAKKEEACRGRNRRRSSSGPEKRNGAATAM